MNIINKSICILLIILFCSCQNTKLNHKKRIYDNLSNTEKEIVQVFSDVDSLLAIDNGKFWGKNLYGPILFVDPKTRIFYSNENNEKNTFGVIGPMFKDSLPNDINIANTAFDWHHKKWSMVMLPLPTEKDAAYNLIIHELFHRLQPEIGFENLLESDNGHLDTYQGRLLLRLELQALKEALKSNEKITELHHIKNALNFRLKRHQKVEIKNAENSLEINEGLAEYTAITLSGRKENKVKKDLIQSINNFYDNPTFVRSFAYQTIPVYGYLLSAHKPNWHKVITRNTNLTEYLTKVYQVDSTAIVGKSIEEIAKQNNYEYQIILGQEIERERKRIARITTLKTKFLENKTLELPNQNMNISFDPGNIIPIEGFGTVYPNLRVTDNWGILTVENEALIAPDWSKVTISEPIKISNKLIKGNGWQLELNPEWKIENINDRFILVKK